MLRRLMFLSLFVLLALPLAAQDKAHTATVAMTETPSAVTTNGTDRHFRDRIIFNKSIPANRSPIPVAALPLSR